jgi:hypothetical protein
MPIERTKHPDRLEVARIYRIDDAGHYEYHADIYVKGRYSKSRVTRGCTLAEAADIAAEHADAILPEQPVLIV